MPFQQLRRPFCTLLLAFATLNAPLAARAQAIFDSVAPNVLVIDHNTGQVLLDRNADVPLPPASMSKLMTLLMLFEAVEDERVALDTQWTVSESAYRMRGSRMFLEMRDRPTTEDLIRGISVLSGNDATVVVAEGLAGSEEAFARLATQRARQLGMENTTLVNSSGWPDPQHRMSLRDLAILAQHIIENYPQYYSFLAEENFTWNNITQDNRLPLIGEGLGFDGLKTGHTSEAGYALTGSALQGERRLVFVFSGLDSAAERIREAERIVNWGFRQFSERRLAAEGQVLAEAEVWMGSERRVPLVAPRDLFALVPSMSAGTLTARVEYDGPVSAPIAGGQVLGRLIVELPELGPRSYPLVAGTKIEAGGFLPRMRSAATVLAMHLGLVGQ